MTYNPIKILIASLVKCAETGKWGLPADLGDSGCCGKKFGIR